jgi:hypothetical protein
MPRADRPVATSILLCENIVKDPQTNIVNLEGVFQTIDATSFPYTHSSFWAYLQLYDFVGSGRGSLLVTVNRTTGEIIADDYQLIRLGPGRRDVRDVYYRIDNCTFPTAGVDWIEFYWNENKIAECPLKLG